MTWRGVQMYTFQFYMLPLTFMVLFLFFFKLLFHQLFYCFSTGSQENFSFTFLQLYKKVVKSWLAWRF